MSLFTSLALIKDVTHSLSPKTRVEDTIDVASSIRFHSPQPISEEVKVFQFNGFSNRLKLQKKS